MDIILPIIFQHARELADLQMGVTESEHHKIITPFPPEGNEFLDFNKDDLEFADPETDSQSAIRDTSRANEYFLRTDNLVLDFSYGIPTEEYRLSRVCQKFYSQAVPKDSPDSADFRERFSAKKGSFLKSKRTTVGDLGNIDFVYTYYSPIQWSRQALNENDIARLQQKALDVYGNLGIQSPVLDALVADIKSVSLCYSQIQYDFGFFEVVRDWADPELFESNHWSFAADGDVLYGEGNSSFDENNVNLLYATRLYVIRNYSGTPKQHNATPETTIFMPQGGIEVRDHRSQPPPSGQVRDHRH